MRFDPGDVLHTNVFLEDHRFEIILFLDQIQTLDDKLAVEIQSMRIIVYSVVDVDRFERFVRKDDVVYWPGIDKKFSVTVKDTPTRSRYRYQSNALAFSPLAVIVPSHDLKVIKPHAQNGQQDKCDRLDRYDPQAQVLYVVTDLHICKRNIINNFIRLLM